MRRGFCPAGFLPAAGNRRWDFSLPGKIEAQRGPVLGKNRGRARLKCSHKHGARLARRRRGLFPCLRKQEPCAGTHPEPAAGVRNAGKKKTRCATCSAQPRELPTAGVPGAGAGFFPARENRSHAWACTRNQPRACETRGRKRHGARLARRSRANCPPQVCPAQARAFSLPEETGAVRGRAPGINRVRARRGKEKKHGARLAHRRCARRRRVFWKKTVDRILFRAYNLS